MPPLTANLDIDDIGAVREGDWGEAHVEAQKVGNRLTSASWLFKVGGRLVLCASGIFVMAPGAKA